MRLAHSRIFYVNAKPECIIGEKIKLDLKKHGVKLPPACNTSVTSLVL
jgi:hypothetical protein